MTYCAVASCKNRMAHTTNLSYFRFPTDPERCKQWLDNSNTRHLYSKDPEVLSRSYRVCGAHFEDKMFFNRFTKNRLHKFAVPTIFPTFTDENPYLMLEDDQNLPNITPLKEEPESIDMILAKYEEVEHVHTNERAYLMLQDGLMLLFTRATDAPELIELISAGIDEMEHDFSEPHYIHRFEINNFSNIRGPLLSPPFDIHGFPWRTILVQKVIESEHSLEYCVDFCIQFNNSSENTAVFVKACAELCVISQKEGVQNLKHEIHNMRYPEKSIWDCNCPILWEDITDESKGYIKDDTVIFEISLIAFIFVNKLNF